MIILQFTSATAATYTSQFMAGAQHGNFTLDPVTKTAFLPPDFTGQTLNVTISKASSPFPQSGSFTQSFATGEYQNSGALNTTGTFSAEALTPNIALLTLTDSADGAEHELVTFTSATKASVLLFDDSSSGYLQGTANFTLNTGATQPAVELLLTITASPPRPSLPTPRRARRLRPSPAAHGRFSDSWSAIFPAPLDSAA